MSGDQPGSLDEQGESRHAVTVHTYERVRERGNQDQAVSRPSNDDRRGPTLTIVDRECPCQRRSRTGVPGQNLARSIAVRVTTGTHGAERARTSWHCSRRWAPRASLNGFAQCPPPPPPYSLPPELSGGGSAGSNPAVRAPPTAGLVAVGCRLMPGAWSTVRGDSIMVTKVTLDPGGASVQDLALARQSGRPRRWRDLRSRL